MEQKRGNLLIFIAAMLFSLGGLCIKFIPWSGMAINGGRTFLSCLILFAYLRYKKQKLILSKGTLIGAACVFFTNVLYSYANTMTTAANAILLQFVAPVFIILLMWLFFREKPKRMDILACILVFAGIACFVLDGLGSGHLLGNICGLLSGLAYAGVFMMNRFPGGDAFSATILGQLTGAIAGIPFIMQETDFSSTTLIAVLVLGIFQMGTAYVFFCTGIQRTTPVTAALIAGVEPIMNPLLVAIFVGEMLSPISALGGLIVLGTIMTYNIMLAKRQQVIEEELSTLP